MFLYRLAARQAVALAQPLVVALALTSAPRLPQLYWRPQHCDIFGRGILDLPRIRRIFIHETHYHCHKRYSYLFR